MKRLILAVLVILSASLASAQETYSVTVGGTATNRNSLVGMLELGRVQQNTDTCARASLPSTCTQAQACVALGVTGGASCTNLDAVSARARIYPATLVGREGFVTNEMIRVRAPEYYAEQVRRDAVTLASYCAASQTNRDALCSLLGLAAGCGACNQ